MFTKLKLYAALTVIGIAVAIPTYYAISLGIQKRQLTETLGQAQTDLAKELAFSEAVVTKLNANDVANKRLRDEVKRLEKAGVKVISTTEITTKPKTTVITKEVKVPGEDRVITQTCEHDFNVKLSIAVAKGIREAYWKGIIELYDADKLVQTWQSEDFKMEDTIVKLDKTIFKEKVKRFSWQVGVGVAYTGDELSPAIYVGYGINF